MPPRPQIANAYPDLLGQPACGVISYWLNHVAKKGFSTALARPDRSLAILDVLARYYPCILLVVAAGLMLLAHPLVGPLWSLAVVMPSFVMALSAVHSFLGCRAPTHDMVHEFVRRTMPVSGNWQVNCCQRMSQLQLRYLLTSPEGRSYLHGLELVAISASPPAVRPTNRL